MSAKLYTDNELTLFMEMPKLITNPKARWLEKPKSKPSHRQRTFLVRSGEDESVRFQVYQRQNMNDIVDFRAE